MQCPGSFGSQLLSCPAWRRVRPAAADDPKACAGAASGGEERVATCTEVIVSGGDLKWAFVSRFLHW